LRDVLIGTLHTSTDLGNVGKDGTTVTFAQTLGWRNLIGLGAAGEQIGVVALDEGEETGDEKRVGDDLGSVVCPDTSSSFGITLGEGLLGLLLVATLLIDTSLGELGLEVAGVLLDLLLLLLEGGGIEFAVGGGLLGIAGLLAGLLGLLLLGKTLEHIGHLIDLLV
jgi:hypothetical protein